MTSEKPSIVAGTTVRSLVSNAQGKIVHRNGNQICVQESSGRQVWTTVDRVDLVYVTEPTFAPGTLAMCDGLVVKVWTCGTQRAQVRDASGMRWVPVASLTRI